MHSLVFLDKEDYRKGVEKVVTDTSGRYKKTCYITFNDSQNIVIKMLEETNIDTGRFVVVDASNKTKDTEDLRNKSYVVDTADLFNVYMFMRNLIVDEKIDAVIIDSVSALIIKHKNMPLKKMITNLLLEIGSFKCDSMVLAFKNHYEHEVLQHIEPLISKNVMM